MPIYLEISREIINKVLNLRRPLLEPEAKEIIKSIGIPVPDSGIANTPEGSVDIAEAIGYPVVLKIISPQVIHKTDFGGVKVGAKNKDEVKRDFSDIIENIKRKIPDAEIKGMLVEKMVQQSTEVIIGGIRDPQFGPAIMFGLGGIFTEILKDVSFRLAPVSRYEALDMMKELKGFPLIEGYRGNKPLDMGAISDALVKVSDLMIEIEEIKEIDLNPVFLYPEGLTVVDARIILRRREVSGLQT